MDETFILTIYRGEPGERYWESFLIPLKPSMNIISALMEIQKNPVNAEGEKTNPVAWEQGCLEEVCGSCSMLVNGVPRQACTALIHELISHKGREIFLAPLTKFPLVRDLIVDRSIMFENLKKLRAWVVIDGVYDRGSGLKISPQIQDLRYTLSMCMTCGCCSEACPQVSAYSPFIGPAAIAQALLFNIHPTGKEEKSARLHQLMEEGGIADCGNAQNCKTICPKKIPLTDAIADISRAVTVQSFKDIFTLPYQDVE